MINHFWRPVLVVLWTVAAVCAQDPPQVESTDGGWNFPSWKLDLITLRTGKSLEGLIESETDRELRLLEIRRSEGRGLFGANRPVARAEIADIRRISPQDRQESRRRFEQYLERGRVAAIQRDNVKLEAVPDAASGSWRYQGEWYTLESRTSQELTRRFVFRLEQMFTAYRRLLPPRVSRREELRIVIHGTVADYQALARSLGTPVENAAFYHPRRNLVAAGSDLAHVSGLIAQAQAQHDAERVKLDRLKADLPKELEKLRQQNTGKLSEPALSKMLSKYSRQIEQEISTQKRTMADFDRQNESIFEQQAGRVLALLHHESFHAYLENYVYPQSEHDVPRWLNEGLAQVFERARLEADVLRVDVPDKSILALLAKDLAANPTTIAKIVTADHRSFLVSHNGDRGNELNYAHAWGIAHYLTFVRPVLGGQAMDQYVAKSASKEDTIARFERLVDQPLAEFEAQWRDWVLKRK